MKSISVSNTIYTLGHEHIMKTVESCTYLGLIINVQVDIKNSINTLAKTGTRALGALIHENKTVVTYCSSVWDTKKLLRLLIVQNKAMRNYLSMVK